MTAEIFSGRIRVQFLPDRINFRVIGNNDERGVEDGLDEVGRLEAFLKRHGICHEAHQRNYGAGHRTDAVVVFVAQGSRSERRRGERRHKVTRRA